VRFALSLVIVLLSKRLASLMQRCASENLVTGQWPNSRTDTALVNFLLLLGLCRTSARGQLRAAAFELLGTTSPYPATLVAG
jgi:hypothetical protein